jgi:hypothetical protein
MASDLMNGLKEVEGIIQQLPQLESSEAADVAEAVALLQQNAEAAQELQQELAAASVKLAQLQDAHGAVAEAALSHRAAVAAAAAARDLPFGAGPD